MLSRFKQISKLLCVSCLFFIASIEFVYAEATEEITNAALIQQYYDMEETELPLKEVVTLAINVIQQGERYTQNTLAMTYALLAEVAYIRGEASRSFQFAEFGLTNKPIAAEVSLNLKLRKASGYFYKGQYQHLIQLMNEVVLLAQRENNIKYQLLGIAYSAMAKSITGDYRASLADLLKIETLLEKNDKPKDFINFMSF